MAEIGGQLTEQEAKDLILKKLYDLVANEQTRYLNAARRGLIAVCENLWDKYAVSSRELEAERAETLTGVGWVAGWVGVFGGIVLSSWINVPLGDLLEVTRNGYAGKQVDRITDFPITRIETISDGVINRERMGYCEDIPFSYLLRKGDILLSNIN